MGRPQNLLMKYFRFHYQLTAYPVAKFLMGAEPAGIFIYIIPFLISTVVGSALAFVLVGILEKGGVLRQMQGAR